MNAMQLYDIKGNRLYLTQKERVDFINLARTKRPEVMTLAETLAYTGCRISEALELIPKRIELDENRLILRTLKKRRDDNYRSVPVPPEYMKTLNIVHRIQESQKGKRTVMQPLWSWSRQTSQIIKPLMIEAGITPGPHRTSKGLRHAFGVNAVMKNIPLNKLQQWMGHSDLKTTAIYANAVGQEEAELAAGMWK